MPIKRAMGKCSLVAIACSLSWSALAVAQTPANLDVPAGELVAALKELARQSDVELVYQPEQLKNFKTEGLKGAYSPQDAVEILLQGTSFRVHALQSGAMVIAPKDAGTGISGMVPSSSDPEDASTHEVIVMGRRDSHVAAFGNIGMRKIPLAIQEASAADIAAANAISLAKILQTDPAYTPGYGATDLSNGSTTGALRGFSASRYMADGMPQNFGWNITPAEAVERVEVWRGPAGFSYGFMSPGGAINIVKKKPPIADGLLNLRTSLDEYGKAGLHLDAGGRVGAGELGYRLNVAATEGDSYLSNSDQKRRIAGLALDYRFSDATLLTFQADYVDALGHGQVEGNRYEFDVNGDLVRGLGQEIAIAPSHHFLSNEIWTAGIQLDTRLTSNIDFSSKLYYSDYGEKGFTTANLGDLDAQGFGTILQATVGQYIEDWNFTNHLTGRFGQGDITHTLTLGMNVGDTTYTGYFAGEFFTGYWVDQASFLPTTYAEPTAPYSVRTVREYGVFLSDVIEIHSTWRALLGVRWSRQQRDNVNPGTGVRDPQETFSKVTPLVGVMYDFTPAFSFYANYASGVETGGRAPFNATNANELMPALVSKQYEVGIKWQLARATLDMAAFQITQPSEFFQGSGTPYVQDGEQRNRGAEVILRGNVLDSLRLMGGVQYLDAKILEAGNVAAIGATASGVPKWQGTLRAELDVAAVPGFSLIGVATGKSERQQSVPNDRRVAPSYVLFDVGARYGFDLAGKQAVAQVTVENVADREYAAGMGYMFGVPRTAWFSFELSLL